MAALPNQRLIRQAQKDAPPVSLPLVGVISPWFWAVGSEGDSIPAVKVAQKGRFDKRKVPFTALFRHCG